MVTQLLFLCYQLNCRKGFTFTTIRCNLQLTQHILTFGAWRSLKIINFIVWGCRFAKFFFCKVTARGPLIYKWHYCKMFAISFYGSCFVNRGNSIGKKFTRPDWEKAIYRSLFMLANTLIFLSKNNNINK